MSRKKLPLLAGVMMGWMVLAGLPLPGMLASPIDHDLPEVEPAQAVQLFNGQDLSGWVCDEHEDYAYDGEPAAWDVVDGMLRCTGQPAGVLRTQTAYENYKLIVEWCWPDQAGDSGVLIHADDQPFLGIWPRSVQVQLKSGHAGDLWAMGADYQVHDAQKRTRGRRTRRYPGDVERPVGQWNTMEVYCHGDHIRVLVNGRLMNEAWDCSLNKGAIALQCEGAAIAFRKVELIALPPTP